MFSLTMCVMPRTFFSIVTRASRFWRLTHAKAAEPILVFGPNFEHYIMYTT
jgi:hypothetical protein